jgi:SAM-dependent methyltransferase
MTAMQQAFRKFSSAARTKRAALFRESFRLDEQTRILDLGSETGANINIILRGTRVRPCNVHIADIDNALVEEGAMRYGYVPVRIAEDGRLPFPDKHFDIVFCSSVIEHVTVPKDEIWAMRSGKVFRNRSMLRQQEFAGEIRRLGKQYFVQTPYRFFPIESHTWLPLVAYLPRRVLIPTLRISNRFWIKKSQPDWHLLGQRQMGQLFDDARLVRETSFMLTKSIMAIKADASAKIGIGSSFDPIRAAQGMVHPD